MQNPRHLQIAPACALGLFLLIAPASLAEPENYEAPFSLTFGASSGNDNGEGLLLTPSPSPFSLQWDALEMTAGHASAMAVVANREPDVRFSVRMDMHWEQFVPNKSDDRVGFAVLGGPHNPPDDPFDTAEGEFYSLTWSPSIDATTSVIEIREGFAGALLAQEVWEGQHPTAANPFGGYWETYQFEAHGSYGTTGALELTLTLTDQYGHSQSVSTTIPEPREGNLFGFGGLLSSDPSGQPQFNFRNFSVSNNVILNEAFVDGQRLVQDLPHTSAWYGTTGNASSGIVNLWQLTDGMITLDASENGQLLTHFTDSNPVSLNVGEALKLSFGFRMQNAGATNQGVRIGLMDSSEGSRVTGDSHGTSHSRFIGYAGYGGFFNPGGAHVTSIRKRTPDDNRLLSNNGVWQTTESIPGTVVIHDDTDYLAEILVSRDEDGVNITFSVSGPNFSTNTVTWTDTEDLQVFAFDTLGIWVNQSAADSFSLTGVEITVLPAEVPVGATFAAWQEEHFPGETDPDIVGAHATPAGDGLANLLKYAFGLEPLMPATLSDVFETEIVEGSLRLTYLERTDVSDIEYVPQASINLIDWEEGLANIQEVSSEPLSEGNFNRVTVEVVLDGNETRTYLRVDVRGVPHIQ